MVTIQMKDKNDRTGKYSSIEAIVTSDIKKKILISGEDQKKLGILHPSYPRRNFNSEEKEREDEEKDTDIDAWDIEEENMEDGFMSRWLKYR